MRRFYVPTKVFIGPCSINLEGRIVSYYASSVEHVVWAFTRPEGLWRAVGKGEI